MARSCGEADLSRAALSSEGPGEQCSEPISNEMFLHGKGLTLCSFSPPVHH